jgi:PPOX class probable F420-dependent enzyme
MEEMTPEVRRAFLLNGTRTAVLATTRADGRPHAVPVGIVLDGDDLLFLTGANTVKVAAVRRDPRVTLVMDDQAPPYSFVMVEGTAETSEDPEQVRHAAVRIGARYHGPEAAEGFASQLPMPGTVLVRVRPSHVVAVDRVAG